MRPVKQTMV